MEEPRAETPPQVEDDVVTSSGDAEPSVQEKNEVFEQESTEGSPEDTVTSSRSPVVVDEEDAGKATSEAKSIEEKPPSSGL